MINALFTFISNLRQYNSYLATIVVIMISYLICGVISSLVILLNTLTWFPEVIKRNSIKVPFILNIIITTLSFLIVMIIKVSPMILLWATPYGLKRTAENFVSVILMVSVALLFAFKKFLYLFKRRV